ncbi:MAG: type II toxin-antitoxin system RelE family toxin [Candidatus Fervidibacter sp.]|uniref:type II toxin-antitoxin system RelE family toxin n=1 Tax=Candidatus Fervidibacter sp. TaxID=3100871 RepID=UPI00404AB31B
MGKFEIVFHREAAKAFCKLPFKIRKRIEAKIEAFQETLLSAKIFANRKANSLVSTAYRLANIVSVDEKRRIVTIEAIGTRGEVY